MGFFDAFLPGNESSVSSLSSCFLHFSTSEERRGARGVLSNAKGEREKKTKMMVVQFFFRSCLGLFRCPMAKEGVTYLPAPPVHQGEARSEKRTRQCALHTTTTTLPSPRLLPYLASLASIYNTAPPPPPLIYDWNFAGETTALGRSDIVSRGPWTSDNSLSHGLVLPDCDSLGGSRACHAPCTWGVPTG
jgi:hypothetical protein